jgi:hypothetical protein
MFGERCIYITINCVNLVAHCHVCYNAQQQQEKRERKISKQVTSFAVVAEIHCENTMNNKNKKKGCNI